MANIEPRTSKVTIYQGDYLDRIRHLEQQAEAAADAEEGRPRRVGTETEAQRLAREHDELVAEAEESALHITLRALRRSEWKKLVADHPPREGNEGDKAIGVNEDTFKEALVPASVVEPTEFTEDDLDSLSDVDFDRLYFAAFALNRAPAAGPKAGLASRLSRETSET